PRLWRRLFRPHARGAGAEAHRHRRRLRDAAPRQRTAAALRHPDGFHRHRGAMLPPQRQPLVAERLADAIARIATPPDGVRRVAEDLVLDVVGLCLAARGTDYARALRQGWDGAGDATVIGHERRLSAAGAALINGAAAHGEDFDDTFEGGPVHAG